LYICKKNDQRRENFILGHVIATQTIVFAHVVSNLFTKSYSM
jgi:hypothetical protein